MNNYEKLTLEKFKSNLEGGKYQNLTGARRAVGKADWTNADRERGRAFADKHFGTSGAPAPKKAASKPSVKKTAPKAKGPGLKKVSRILQTPNVPNGINGVQQTGKDFVKLQSLHISQQVIAAASAAIEAMKSAKNTDDSIDISEMQGAVNLIATAVNKMDSVIGGKSVAPATSHANGVPAEAALEEVEGPDPLFERPAAE